MGKSAQYISLAVGGLLLTGCGSDGAEVTELESTDYTGTWVSGCRAADTSQVAAVTDLYFLDRLVITEDRVSTGASVYSDSDCVTPSNAVFVRMAIFDEGEYVLTETFVTESGLTAELIRIRVIDSEEVITNSIGIVADTLYFGYSPFDGLADDQAPPRVLDLSNGYRRL